MSTRRAMWKFGFAALVAAFGLGGGAAVAADPAVGVTPAGAPPTVGVAAAPPAPYSVPWQLRPAGVGTILRSDTSIAAYEAANGDSGSTVASMLLGTYKITPSLAPLVRVGIVRNQEPGPTLDAGTAFVNPIVGLTYGRKLPGDLRLALFGAGTIPIGMGGDASPAMDETAAALSKGILARSAMDNAMFAVNYFVAMGGFDLAWVANRVTIQLEATILELLRVRNEQFAPESTRTNLASGLHVGVFAASWLSLGSELRYQRWLSTPQAVKRDPKMRDIMTVALGPRFHFPIGGGRFVRPGISYTRALDDPMESRKYHIVQLDVPVVF